MSRREDTSAARFDERDTMFARAAREPGTAQYDEYYDGREELRAIDDKIRALPLLFEPGGRYHDHALCEEAQRYFDLIQSIDVDEALVESWSERLAGGAETSSTLKAMALSLGAVAAGCCRVEERFLYSHKGRLDHDFGEPIDASEHAHALVFLVEMDHDAMQRAPRARVVVESAREYHRAAVISKTISATLRAVGKRAYAHYDAHYAAIMPPLAVAAGLGELGRNNILVADRFGARVRIGAVTTDLHLEPDNARSLGVGAFCQACKKCSESCPTGSLSNEEPELVDGSVKWSTRVETCYAYWRRIGTDCGICMAVCPFSHADNWFHNFVRGLVRRFPSLARAAVLGDDAVYGRRWENRRKR